MKDIKFDFKFEKYRESGEIKDISKLYLKFFNHIGLTNKADELKKAYSLNKLLQVIRLSLILLYKSNPFSFNK